MCWYLGNYWYFCIDDYYFCFIDGVGMVFPRRSCFFYRNICFNKNYNRKMDRLVTIGGITKNRFIAFLDIMGVKNF